MMKLRKARQRELKDTKPMRMMAEEEAEEDDDNATLQDCLDRQKKVTTVGSKRKRVALTPLDDEDCRREGRKKSKGIQELLAADPASAIRSGQPPMPFSSENDSAEPTRLDRDVLETGGNVSQEGTKRKMKRKRRRCGGDVSVGGGNGEMVLHDTKLNSNASENTEDLTTSESARKIFIRVAKVELADGRRRGSCVTADNQSGPRTGSPGVPVYGTGLLIVEDIFLPGDGYHTCGDAENCLKIPCLEQVLDHLDKMSEEQLKLWYKAITGEVFASRNGEKVRGRLRRMIKCKVKEIIKSQCSDSTVSSQSWRSSPETQQACGTLSPPTKPVAVADSLIDSPGSKMSASNAGDGSVEAEDAVCSGKMSPKGISSASVSSSSEISRELTFQLPASKNSFTIEASANSSVDDPELALPPVTARITRSKAKGLVQKCGIEQEEYRNKDQCMDRYQDSYLSSLDRNLPNTPKESDVPWFNQPVSSSGGPTDCDASGQPVKSSFRSRKESFAVEEIHKEVFSTACCDPKGKLVEGAAEETTAAPIRSRKKSFVVEEVLGERSPISDCILNDLPFESAAVGTTSVATRSRRKSFAVEKVIGEVLASADDDVHGLLLEGAGAEATAVATRSRMKRDFVAAVKVLGDVPSSADCDVICTPVVAALATTGAIRSRKKGSGSGKLPGEVSFLADCSVVGLEVDSAAVLSAAAATRSRKKREVLGEVSFAAVGNMNGPPVEGAAAKQTTVATRSRKKSFSVENILVEVPSLADCELSGLLVEGVAIETIAVATRSSKKRELVVAEEVLGEVSSPPDRNAGGPSLEAAAAPTTVATRSRKKSYAVEKVPGEVSSSARCEFSGVVAEVAVTETTIAASRLRKKRGLVATEEVFREPPSSADCDLLARPGEAGAAETTTAATRSRKKNFVVEKVLGEVSPSPDCNVNGLPEGGKAVETPAFAARALDKRESVAAEKVFGEISTPADCDVSGPPAEGANGETTTAATCFAVEKVLVEVYPSADCGVSDLPVEGAAATPSCKNGEFVDAEKVPEDVSTSADCDVKTILVETAASGSTKAVSGSNKKREIVAAEEGLGEVSSSSNLDCNDGLHHAAEEPTLRFQHSRDEGGDSGKQGVLSLSEEVMNLVSNGTGKSSLSSSEITAVDGQQCSGSGTRESDTQSFLSGSEKAWHSTLISAAASSTIPYSVFEKVLVEMNDVSFEGTQLSMRSQSQCESVVSVCQHDDAVEEILMEIDQNSCPDLQFKGCTSNISCPMARAPWEDASFCEFGESSELSKLSSCSKSSDVAATCDVDDVRTNASSNLNTEGYMEDAQVEQNLVSEAVQLQRCNPSSNSSVVCPVSSSGLVLEITSDYKFSTKCEELSIGDDDDCLPREEETSESSDKFMVADCVSFMPSSASLHFEDVQLAATGLPLCEERHTSVGVKYVREDGERMVSETGDGILFEQLSAQKVSILWPARDEKKSYFSTRNCHEMEDVTERKSVCTIDSTTSSRPVKWHLLKCDSGRSKESSVEATGAFEVISVPKVWRDAGEFLEELDNVYMMLDTETSSSSYPLRKRKYHDSDFGDYRCEPPDDATHCSCDPPRTRQRVEFVAALGSCAVTGNLLAEGGDVWDSGGDLEHIGDVEQAEVQNGPSTFVDSHINVKAETSAISGEDQDPVSSQYHQEMWIDDQRRDEGSIVEIAPIEKEMAMYEKCSGTSSFTTEACLSPPPHWLGDSFLDSPTSLSTSDQEGIRELVVKSDACVDLLACERLVQEDDTEDYEQSSELLAAGKMEPTREDNSGNSPSPPRSLPPIRLKLPSGRARLIASALTESKLKSGRDWRYSEARALDRKSMVTTALPLSPNSSDEDTGDSIQEQETNVFETVPAEDRSNQKLLLVLSPTSPKSPLPPPPSSCNSSLQQQENVSSPESHVPPPCTARCAKGILKTSPKCKECVELRFQARTASDFVASQMKTFGEVAGRLTQEIQDLRSILETRVSSAPERLQDDDAMQDTVKAISRSRDIEQSAEKNLTLLLRDCKRFCKLTCKRPQRRIVFADEAGKKLCHVKTFQVPPALARSLWDVL